MWRAVISRTPKLLDICSKQKIPICKQSSNTNQNKGGGGRVFIALVGAGTLGVGGAVVYASYNPEFRHLLQNNLPYSDAIFTYIPDWGAGKPKPVEKPTPTPTDVSLMKKKQERIAAKKSEEAVPTEKETIPLSPLPASLEKAKLEAETAKKKAQEQQQQLKQQQQENQSKQKQEESQNSALEIRLRDSQDNVDRLAQDSLLSYQRATEAIRHHAQTLFKALDMDMENSTDAWQDVHFAQENKATALTKATETVLDARAAIEHLEEAVKSGKENPMTGNNSALFTAEEALDRAKKQMQEAQAKMSEAQGEFGLAQGYQNLIDEGRQQLQRELQDILPQQAQGKELNAEDLNVLLVHAHQRLLQLQKKLAKQQSSEQGRVDQALSRQKGEQEVMSRHQDELTRQRRELELKIANQASELRDEFETEMRQQLRRAAAAHADHLQEALGTQRDELQRHHGLRCRDQLLEQQATIQATLGPAMTRLKALEAHLKAHEELQASSRRAQRLWLAAQSLRQSLVRQSSSSEITGPLEERVEAVRRAACISSKGGDQGPEGSGQIPEDPLYGALLNSLPSEALNRGVYHEGALKDRFSRAVEPQCRRAALMDKDETEGSLYVHLLSRLQSMLLFENVLLASSKPEEDENPRSTYGILRAVRRSLAAGDLEQALHRANRLSGVPRRLAGDWTREVRLHLEVRQVADAVMAQAAAINVQAQQ